MKRRLTLLAAALALALTACTGPAAESAPPAETDTQAPSVASGEPTPSAPEPSPSGDFSPVYTDWSRLEPYRPDRGRYTRYYEGFTDRLLPAEGGYGGLIPFPGASVSYEIYEGGFLFGLATADGTVVCDPVYERIFYPSSYDQELNQYVENNDFLILGRTFFEGDYDPVYYWLGEYVYTVAAGDGSWVLEEEYSDYFELSDGRLLLMDADEVFWICGTDGTLVRSPLEAKPSRLWGDEWWKMGTFSNGAACIETFDADSGEQTGCCLANALTGEVVDLPDLKTCYSSDYNFDEWAAAQDRETGLWGYLDRHGSWSVQPQFRECDRFEGEYACVTLANGEKALIDRSGQAVLQAEGDDIRRFSGDNSLFYLILERKNRQYFIRGIYDQNFTPLPDHPILDHEIFMYGTTAASVTRDGDVWNIWDVSGVMYTVETDAEFCGAENGLLRFRSEDYNAGLYDPETETWVIPIREGCYEISQCGGLEETVYAAWRGLNECDLLDADGTLIAHADDLLGSGNGLIRVRDGGYGGFLDTAGNWVFRWPLRSNSD